MEFTEIEQAILHIVQQDLPDTATPYADIAEQLGIREEQVLDLLQSLKTAGVIRRFGASIKHQKVGYAANVMVAWHIADELIDAAGETAAKHPNISHCYHRPSSFSHWPYTLYTMIHGQSEAECEQVIAELCATTTLKKYEKLKSIKELKKTSMHYF